MVEVIGVIDTALITFAWILSFLALCLVIWFVFITMQYKHTIIIREVLNKRRIITLDKFRIYTDPNTGIEWYKLKKFRQQIPTAPKEALEMTNKGKLICEAYRLPSGDVIYIQDETEDIKNIDTKDTFKPITTSQRVVQYHLYENKMKFKRKSWKDLIIPVVGLIALTVIIVSLMAFWGDLAKPVLEMGDKMATVTDKQGEITETLQEIIQERQVISGEPTNPPPPN